MKSTSQNKQTNKTNKRTKRRPTKNNSRLVKQTNKTNKQTKQTNKEAPNKEQTDSRLVRANYSRHLGIDRFAQGNLSNNRKVDKILTKMFKFNLSSNITATEV